MNVAGLMGYLAMAGGAAGQGAGAGAKGGGLLQFAPMLIIVAIFFVLLRSQQRREKERRAMMDSVKTGDRILFGGGILGTVANVKETVLVVKVAENVKLEVVRGAVTRVLEKGEKAEADATK